MASGGYWDRQPDATEVVVQQGGRPFEHQPQNGKLCDALRSKLPPQPTQRLPANGQQFQRAQNTHPQQQQGHQIAAERSRFGGLSKPWVNMELLKAQIEAGPILPDPSTAHLYYDAFARVKGLRLSSDSSPVPIQSFQQTHGTPQFELSTKPVAWNGSHTLAAGYTELTTVGDAPPTSHHNLPNGSFDVQGQLHQLPLRVDAGMNGRVATQPLAAGSIPHQQAPAAVTGPAATAYREQEQHTQAHAGLPPRTTVHRRVSSLGSQLEAGVVAADSSEPSTSQQPPRVQLRYTTGSYPDLTQRGPTAVQDDCSLPGPQAVPPPSEPAAPMPPPAARASAPPEVLPGVAPQQEADVPLPVSNADVDPTTQQLLSEAGDAPTILDGDFPPLGPAKGPPAEPELQVPTPRSPIPIAVQREALSRLVQTVDVFDAHVPDWVFEETITPKGVENKGQICYIISALQSLMDVAPGIYRAIFRAHGLLLGAQQVVVSQGIQAEDDEGRRESKDGKVKGLPLLLAHQLMLEAYFDEGVPVVAATRMQKIGRVVMKDFQVGQQEDAVEFLCSYLLQLNQELKTLQLAAKKGALEGLVEAEHVVEDTWHVGRKKGKRNSMLEGQQRIQQQHTTIADAVWGITSYAEYKSSRASRCSQLQLYYILMLPLTRANGSGGGGNGAQSNGSNGKAGGGKQSAGGKAQGGQISGSLQGLVDSYFAEQQLEDRHQQDTVEEAKLGHAPKILMAQLLRFTYNHAYKQIKLSDNVQVSNEIQMPHQQRHVRYKLRSVIMHAGNSVDYGHYYVSLRQAPQDGPKTLVLDDQLIGDKPRSSNKGDAYIITYVRDDE